MALLRDLKRFRHAKHTFIPPQKLPIAIFDNAASQEFFRYISKDCCHVIPNIFEEINWRIVLNTVLQLRWSFRAYYELYVRSIQPALLLTFLDNSQIFYKLNCGDTIKAAIQNGVRDVFLNKLTKSSNPKNTIIFCFGDNSEILYSGLGNCIKHGSFRHNANYRPNACHSGLVFISQYRTTPFMALDCDNGRLVTNQDFFLAEKLLVTHIDSFCQQLGIDFSIAGFYKTPTSQAHERHFYRELLGRDCVVFSDSYRLVSKSEWVVFIDSTLGYEALAAGKKTANFSWRAPLLSAPEYMFGWPSISYNGPFWSNVAEKSDVKRILSYITQIDDSEWEITSKDTIQQLMRVDYGNSLFREFINSHHPGNTQKGI
jgi:surface carbohydrate biosynthesis protein